jgi:diguanylate cyclase (GGDEF)-like protein
VAVLLLDLDRFKPINDTFGHSYGDEFLRHLAQTLADVLRESDTVARIGGDEFAVLLTDSDGVGSCQVAAKLIQAVAEPCAIDGRSLSVGTSIGIALYPDHSDEVEVLIQQADAAMYEAKRSGSGYRLYSAGHGDGSAAVPDRVPLPID